jgi:phage-related protein
MPLNDWFEWKGTRCTAYGIRVVQQPEIIRPPERAAFTSVPGRSGTLTTLEGADVYDDFLLTVECVITDTSQLNAILAWLKGDDKVAFANRQGGFYYARIVNQISLEQILRGNPHRRFSVTFRCQPLPFSLGL